MTPPEAPSAPPPRGRHQRTGGAGSAVSAWGHPFHASRVAITVHMAAARALPARVRGLAPGVAIAGLIALGAGFVSEHQGGPQLLYALLFGVCFNHVLESPRLVP